MTNGEATATLVVGEDDWTVYDGTAPKGYTSNLVNTDNTVYSALGTQKMSNALKLKFKNLFYRRWHHRNRTMGF